jgi:hypothetical protein
MRKKGIPYKRVSIYVPLPEHNDIIEGAKNMNMAISSYCNVLIKLGLQVVKVSRDPSMVDYFRKLEQEKG